MRRRRWAQRLAATRSRGSGRPWRTPPRAARAPSAWARRSRRSGGSRPTLLSWSSRCASPARCRSCIERLRQALDAGPVTLDDLPAGLRDQWINEQGQARVLVRPAAPITDNAELEAFATAVLGEAPAATGTPIIVLEGGREVVSAFREASILALAVITILLVIVLHKVRDLFFVLAPLALAVLFTAATAVLLGLELNFANVIALPLLLGLGVSGAVHVVMRWREEGRPRDLAATSTPRAVMFSALTTVASFGSLAISDHVGLASMGLLLTIAIFWSLVCNLLILPSMPGAGEPAGRSGAMKVAMLAAGSGAGWGWPRTRRPRRCCASTASRCSSAISTFWPTSACST